MSEEIIEEKEKEQPAAETELELDITMSTGVLYDYMLRHSYSSAAGLLGSCFGVLGILFFLKTHYPLYLIMGIIILGYLPVSLAQRAKLQMLTNPVFKEPLHYCFSADGMQVSQGESQTGVEWSGCTKAVSTKKSIIIYTGKNNASIFPRNQLDGGPEALLAVIGKYMDPKKVKIRF